MHGVTSGYIGSMKIRNDFFLEKSAGKYRILSLRRVLELVLGGGFYMSKRLAPPMAVCNARIFCGKKLVWKGDLDVFKLANKIDRVAKEFKVVLEVLHESGEDPVWTSAQPENWQGYCGELKAPQRMTLIYPVYEKIAKQRQESWMIDHGFAKKPRKKKAKSKK